MNSRTADPREKLPSLADVALEAEIRKARMVFSEHPTTPNWQRLRALVAQRSPAQVARMERQKGMR